MQTTATMTGNDDHQQGFATLLQHAGKGLVAIVPGHCGDGLHGVPGASVAPLDTMFRVSARNLTRRP